MRELVEELKQKEEFYHKVEQKAFGSLEKNRQEGHLQVSKSNGVIQYYVRQEGEKGNGKYLPKKQHKIAEAIAQRDYDRQVIKCAGQWQQWIEKTIRTMPKMDLGDIYDKSKGRKPLITPYEISDEEFAFRWEKIEYKGKEFPVNAPEIYTERGERVRSKSEKMIADKLHLMGIPYRYEYPVYLQGYGMVYPDFLLLNKYTRREIILEHFGMMDSPEYSEKAIRKMNLYMKNGYLLGNNFLVTFETTENPLDVRTIEKCCFSIGISECP